MNPNKIMWWGYLHQNGTAQLKRWFGDPRDYTEDCFNNPFIQEVVEPFEAPDRQTAYKILKDALNLGQNDNQEEKVKHE